MKHIYTIYSLLLIIVIVLLLSCKAGNQEAYQDYALEEEAVTADSISLQETFLSDSLSEANLRAFEDRAIQKLHDVMDLIEILSEGRNDSTFRHQAKAMLLENFESPDKNRISLILPDVKPFRLTVSQFADTLLNNRFPQLKLKILSATLKQPFALVNENRYQGLIYFQLEPGANLKTLYPKDLTTTIILKKRTKDFGGSAREVWEVFLGNIEN